MLDRVTAYIDRYALLPEEGRIVVAVSGGADSLCLLHLLRRLCGPGGVYPRLRLHAAHLNHQLRGAESAEDARVVAHLVESWGIPLTLGSVDVPRLAREERRSLEDAARVARYSFLRAVAAGASIAVAHHADDQVETLLLHWLRGSGLSGLVGMQPRQQDIIRPLLEITHAETLAYCAEHQITPVEDQSNSDPRFLRNRLRHEVLPLLRELNPGLGGTLLRGAEVLRVDLAWLETQVERCWDTVVVAEGPRELRLNARALRELPLSLQRHLLRRVSASLCAGQSPLEPRHFLFIEELLNLSTKSMQERELHLPQRLHAHFQGDELLFTRVPDASTGEMHSFDVHEVTLSIPGEALLPGTPWRVKVEIIDAEQESEIGRVLAQENWSALWRVLPPPAAHLVYIDGSELGAQLLVRTRRPGDRLQPLGMVGEKKVQDIFIDRHITRSARDTTPIFCGPAHCLWIAGACLDHRVRLTRQTRRVLRLSVTPTE